MQNKIKNWEEKIYNINTNKKKDGGYINIRQSRCQARIINKNKEGHQIMIKEDPELPKPS